MTTFKIFDHADGLSIFRKKSTYLIFHGTMVSKFDEVVTSTIIDIILCSHEIFFSTFRMYDFKTLKNLVKTQMQESKNGF